MTFKKLGTIPWKDLKHAYGSAEDVPDIIRNLLSDDEDCREEATYDLYGNIFHQGTRYTASPYAIPFLFELVASDTVKDRYRIIHLLINLALGYEQAFLPQGIDVEQYKKDLRDSDAAMSAEEKAESITYGFTIQAYVDCYDNFNNGASILLDCLQEDDQKLRQAATYALTWLPENAAATAPLLLQTLQQRNDDNELANALLSLGLLARCAKTTIDVSALENYLESDSTLIRTCAATLFIASPIQPRVLDILLEGLSLKELELVKEIDFNDGRISQYISKLLGHYCKVEKATVLPALINKLKQADAEDSLEITSTLLNTINENRTVLVKNDTLENLTTLELDILQAIYHHGAWFIDEAVFVNYTQLLRYEGFPDSKEALGQFLQINQHDKTVQKR